MKACSRPGLRRGASADRRRGPCAGGRSGSRALAATGARFWLGACLFAGALACVAPAGGDGAPDGQAAEGEAPASHQPTILRPAVIDPQLAGAGAWFDGVRYPSLRAVLLTAPSGAVIELEPGMHPGPVELSKSVELKPRSAEADVIIDSRSPVVLRVRAGAEVTLSHIVLRADGPARQGGDAAVVVQNATLNANSCRIFSRRSGGMQVLGGKLDLEGVSLRCEEGQTAIMVSATSIARLRSCQVESAAHIGSGVEVWNSECTVSGGSINAGTAALVAGADGRLRADSVELRGAGAACLVDGTLELVACDISEAKRAVSVRGAARLTGCRLVGNETAVLMAGPNGYLTLSSTVFVGNGSRLAFVEGAEEHQVHDKDAP